MSARAPWPWPHLQSLNDLFLGRCKKTQSAEELGLCSPFRASCSADNVSIVLFYILQYPSSSQVEEEAMTYFRLVWWFGVRGGARWSRRSSQGFGGLYLLRPARRSRTAIFLNAQCRTTRHFCQDKSTLLNARRRTTGHFCQDKSTLFKVLYMFAQASQSPWPLNSNCDASWSGRASLEAAFMTKNVGHPPPYNQTLFGILFLPDVVWDSMGQRWIGVQFDFAMEPHFLWEEHLHKCTRSRRNRRWLYQRRRADYAESQSVTTLPLGGTPTQVHEGPSK